MKEEEGKKEENRILSRLEREATKNMSFSTLFLYITMSTRNTFFFISEFLYTKSTNSHFRHPRSQSTTKFSKHPRVLLPINGQIIWQSCKKQSENVLFSNDHDDDLHVVLLWFFGNMYLHYFPKISTPKFRMCN